MANEQDTMTEEMDLQLQEEARTERNASKQADAKKKPYEKAMEEDHPEIKEQPAEKPQPEPSKEETVEEPVKEAEPIKTEPENVDDVVSQWAVKHNLTVEQAKEDLDKTKSIVEKYKSPEEMARALRQIQSERDILKNETSRQAQPVVPPAVQQDPRIEINQYVANNAENIINQYKQRFPNKSAILTDEAILEEVAEKHYEGYQSWANQQRQVVKDNASMKRNEVLNNLSQDDKAYMAEIKPVLMEMADGQILAKDFSVKELISWAKGKNIDRLLKEAEERGYKRAKSEGTKILGQMPTSTVETKTNIKKPSGTTASLSAYEKERALEMYDGTTMTEEEKYQAFAETMSSAKKKQEKQK
jgi:hypothetical protein